jgi:hypothetical protein
MLLYICISICYEHYLLITLIPNSGLYFEFGVSKLPDNQLKKLDSIPVKYFLPDIDSIHYIGMADSVGDFEANLKLSEKRARNTAQYCERFMPKKLRCKITALGERTILERYKNRRVDIVLYFQPPPKEEPEPVLAIPTAPHCYYIDYELLHRCHIRTVSKRKKEMIIIEAGEKDLLKKKEQYYGSVNKAGDFEAYKVKWSYKNSGSKWWSEARYMTTIPKKDFDRYKIFTIGEPPCDTCSEDYQNHVPISKEDHCLQVDRFLMKNIQFRTTWFNNRWAWIRVPQEYVNLNDRYFIGCNAENELKWEVRKGKRKQAYYYSKLPRYFNYMVNITRRMDCCKYDPEPSECDKPMIFLSDLASPDKSFKLIAEIGSYYQQKSIIPYFGLGVSKEGEVLRGSFILGTDLDLSVCGAFRFQYQFVSFPFSALNPVSVWQSPSHRAVIERYGRLYLGTELKSRINKKSGNYLEQNIHLGLAFVNASYDSFLPRIFIQYGLGYDYLRINSKRLYPVLQLGLNMRITSFGHRQ